MIPFVGTRKRVFYGWWIVVIGICVDALKHGTFNRGFTFYVLPIRNELGIGIAAISLAEMLGRMEGGLQGPLLGWMTDRFFGGRRAPVICVLLLSLGAMTWFYPQVVEAGLLPMASHPEIANYQEVALPLRLDGERPRGDRPPPSAGEHTSEILAELGYTEEEVQGFIERGVAFESS